MAARPIVFAMANPDPEITYDEAVAARKDVIIATGRSDYPNQVNNVLGFPFIFRGALDVHATAINEEMKLAATRALAALAKEDVPDSVCQAYGVTRIRFGPEYIIPKPFDPRVLVWEASAVARAAMETGVAKEPVDLEEYRERLERLLGKAHEVMRLIIHKAQSKPQARGVSGRRERKDPAGGAHPGGGKDRAADADREYGSDSSEGRGPVRESGRVFRWWTRQRGRSGRRTSRRCTNCGSDAG